MSQWYHCSNNKGLPDSTLSQAWQTSKCISFVFHHRSQAEVQSKSTDSDCTPIDESSKDLKNKNVKQSNLSDEEEYSDDDGDNSKDSDFE